MKRLRMLFSKMLRQFSQMKPGAEVGDEGGWRFVLHRTGVAKLAAAVLLVLGGVWLFIGILEDILSGDPLVTVDRMLHRGLQGLRVPLIDHVMVALSELGDAAVTVPVSTAVLITLLLRREWRSAGYWVAAIAAAADISLNVAGNDCHGSPLSIGIGLYGCRLNRDLRGRFKRSGVKRLRQAGAHKE